MKELERVKEIERSIVKKYHKEIWTNFVKAVKEYELIKEGDRIAVCISGGKDSFLLAKLMQELKRHRKFEYELKFIVMDPGYNPENRNVYTQDNVRYIMIDVADRKTRGGHKRTELRNDDYRGVMTIEGTKILNPTTYKDEYRRNGSKLGGGRIIYNMWAKDKKPTVKIAKLSGVAGDDKAFVKALEDIFDGYKKPRTAKTQQAILETMENITYVQIAKVQIAEENMKLLEEKYKNAESMDAFYQDKENQEIFKQMAKYQEDLGKAILTTSKMEEVY